MKSLHRARSLASSLVLLSAFACNDPSNAVATKASADSTSKAATTDAKSTARAGDSADSAIRNDAAPPASVAATGAAPSTASPANVPAPVGAPSADIPKAKLGILDPGVADGILPKNAEPVVVVMDAGAEPRDVVRYKLAENSHGTFGMTMEMEITIEAGDKKLPVKVPGIGMNFDVAIGAKDPTHGDVAVNAKLSDIKLVGAADDLTGARMMSQLDPMKGMSISNFLSEEGRVRDPQLVVPPGVNPASADIMEQMKQSLTSMTPPLPHEPVGVGAKWRAITRSNTGVDALMYTTFTLKSRSGDKLELDTDIQQLLASPEMTIKGAAGGSVRNFDSHGQGKSSVDLTKVAPSHANATVDLQMGLDAAGESAAVHSHVIIGVGPTIK